MSENGVPGLELVLHALRELTENNRRAMDSISAFHTASITTKATHDAQIDQLKTEISRYGAAVGASETRLSAEIARYGAAVTASEARFAATITALDSRLRTVEGGYESAKVIPVADLSSKIQVLSTKHEGLYTRFSTIAAISGAVAAAVVSAIFKFWLLH